MTSSSRTHVWPLLPVAVSISLLAVGCADTSADTADSESADSSTASATEKSTSSDEPSPTEQSTTADAAGGSDAAPQNIIYLVGDGMGYDHVAATNLYETGQSRYQVEGEADPEALEEQPGDPVQVFEGNEWELLGMSTYAEGSGYDGDAAWSDHDWVNDDYTDSAASGTAMATGAKTANGMIGVNSDGEATENTAERAKEMGKAAGVVSDVPFSHATPAAWGAHNEDRNDYESIAAEMIDGELDVVLGAGHPYFDDDNQRLEDPDFGYIGEEHYEKVSSGETDFTYIEEAADFEALANGEVDASRYFGLAQVGSTLQFNRDGESEAPGDVEFNEVADLATMSTAALNVLDQNDEGFHLMIEGGAIDWAGHANDLPRNIEETQSFNDAAEAVVDWVEENSSWEETLVVVTADHETGYLAGADEDPRFEALEGEAGQMPEAEWYSEDHTNMLVPIFFRGAGSEDIIAEASATDPVRGDYVDNTTVADVTLNQWWVNE